MGVAKGLDLVTLPQDKRRGMMTPAVNSVSQEREAKMLSSTPPFPDLLSVICDVRSQLTAKRKCETGFAIKYIRGR